MSEATVGPEESPRVTVLCGGPSEERAVSLESGAAVAEALARAGRRVSLTTIDDRVDPHIPALRESADVVFIALHGRYGEDGGVQEALEDAGIAYTGSDPASSRAGMLKTAAKRMFEASGLRTPKYTVIERSNGSDAPARVHDRGLTPPVVVKPVASGSSIGVSIVREDGALGAALERAWTYGPEALVEEYVAGRELTVGVLGDQTLPVIELASSRGFFDYESKYNDGLTRVDCPARIDPDVERAVRHAGAAAFEAVKARDFGRVDLILSGALEPMVLEVNTIPGFTSHSLLPVAARQAGIAFEDLVWRIAQMALARRRHR